MFNLIKEYKNSITNQRKLKNQEIKNIDANLQKSHHINAIGAREIRKKELKQLFTENVLNTIENEDLIYHVHVVFITKKDVRNVN